jgi:hypothetical protein
VSFGSNFEKIFPQSVIYNEKNLKFAVSQVSTFKADMEGTEILEPLNNIVKE